MDYSDYLSGIQLTKVVNVSGVDHKASVKSISPEKLSNMWQIGLDSAKLTFHSTTQTHIRDITNRSEKRFKTLRHHRQYKHLSGYLSHFASDTFEAKVRSLTGNKYIQLFCNRGNYSEVYPIENKSDAHLALSMFFNDVGIPSEILTDGAKELTRGKWKEKCQRYEVVQRTTEPYSPWQNHAEREGGIIKRKVRSLMRKTNTPVRLWDYCWKYVSGIRSLTATNHPALDGRTPFELVHGYTPNISEYTLFEWFQWVKYHDPADPDVWKPGRWLGPATHIGQGMAFNVLTEKGEVKVRSSVLKFDDDSLEKDNSKRRKDDFTKEMESYIGNYSKATIRSSEIEHDDPYDALFPLDNLSMEDDPAMVETDVKIDPEKDPPFVEDHDKMLGTRIPFTFMGETIEGVVKGRKRNSDGTLVGTENKNPILDSRVYEVELPDGSYSEYSYNVLLENLHGQTDIIGNTYALLKEISDHRMEDDAIPTERGWVHLANNIRKRVTTTKG